MITQNQPFDGSNIIRDMFIKKQTESDAYKLLQESEAIFKLVNSNNVNNKELENRLDSIKELFLTCTKEGNNELSLDEKISLKYAFRDILDEVNLKMHQNASIRNSQQQGRTGFVPIDTYINLALYAGDLALKALMYTADVILPTDDEKYKYEFRTTEEHVIKKVQNAFASIEQDQRFDRYEAQSKKINATFNIPALSKNIISSFADLFPMRLIAKKTDPSLEKENRWVEVKKVMEIEHIKKTENLSITPPPINWEGLFNPLLDKAFDVVLELKRELIRKVLEPYTPEILFKGQSCAQVLASILREESSQINELASALVTGISGDIIENIRTRLANNLQLITEDYNLARLAIMMNLRMANLFYALDTLDANASKEDLINSLGIKKIDEKPLSAEKFIEKTHGNIISNICKLSLTESDDSDKTIEGFIKSKWTTIGNSALEATVTSLIKRLVNSKDIKDLLSKIPQLPNSRNLSAEWEVSDRINNNIDILILFLVDSLVEEMATIASKARRAKQEDLPINVSQIPDEQAAKFLQDSTLNLAHAFRNFLLPSKEEVNRTGSFSGLLSLACGGLINRFTFDFINYMLPSQGEGNLTDIATPIYKEWIKKWTAWASK